MRSMTDAAIALARDWSAELRSAKFTTARFALHAGKAYDPLGVLSKHIRDDVTVRATGWRFDGRSWTRDGKTEAGTIPWDVWAAIGFDRAAVGDGQPGVPSAGFVAERADHGATFETIADYIDLALGGADVRARPPAGKGA